MHCSQPCRSEGIMALFHKGGGQCHSDLFCSWAQARKFYFVLREIHLLGDLNNTRDMQIEYME